MQTFMYINACFGMHMAIYIAFVIIVSIVTYVIMNMIIENIMRITHLTYLYLHM